MVEKINIGAEIEFSCRDIQNLCEDRDLFLKLNLEREYYAFQVEFNNILLETNIKKEDIIKTLFKVKRKILSKAFQIDKALDKEIYLSHYQYNTCGGVVFNGLHLHLGVPNMEMNRLSREQLMIIIQFAVSKKSQFLSQRFILSHHIWGAFRNSDYEFKRKPKFKPVISTAINTLEFRLFDLEDLFYRPSIEMVADVLFKVATAIKTNNFFALQQEQQETDPEIFFAFCNMPAETQKVSRVSLPPMVNSVFYSHRIKTFVNQKRKIKIKKEVIYAA